MMLVQAPSSDPDYDPDAPERDEAEGSVLASTAESGSQGSSTGSEDAQGAVQLAAAGAVVAVVTVCSDVTEAQASEGQE
jgi:hypothetical protein